MMKRIRVWLILLGLLNASVAPGVSETPLALDPQSLEKYSERIMAMLAKADLVFVGRVKALGPAPGYYSGRIPAYQEVTYDVVEILKLRGSYKSPVVVRHVVAGTVLTDPDTAFISLSPVLFRTGSRLIVSAVRQDSSWVTPDGDVDAMPANDTNLLTVKTILKSHP